MNTKISGMEPRPIGIAGSAPVSRARDAASGDDATASAGSADVSITQGARQLATLEKRIASLPEVDEARVAATSQALEQGRYQVDPQRIASRLIRMDAELFAAANPEKP